MMSANTQAQVARTLPHNTEPVDLIDLPPVRFYIVIGQDQNNKSHFLSPMLATLEQASAFLVCAEQYQRVFIQENTDYFQADEEADRQALLAQIVTDALMSSAPRAEYARHQA
jgi:hypothetical protein